MQIKTAYSPHRTKIRKLIHYYFMILFFVSIAADHLSKLTMQQVAQLWQRDRAAGWVSYGQKWKTGNGRQHITDIIGIS